MQLFYTSGIKIPLLSQLNPSKSLGGFICTTLIPNNGLDKVFDGLSLYTLKDANNKDVIGLILQNTTGGIVNNVTFYFDSLTSTSLLDYLLNLVGVGLDNNGNAFIEVIQAKCDPFTGTFQTCYGSGNALIVSGPLANNGFIGIWIKRQNNQTLVNNYFSNAQVQSRFDTTNLIQQTTNQEQINLNISWS